ncbi:MAG: hypothetical protein LQ342_005888 [Letrouitia transgressa]|nr:MAG: hypothetical protein LQ342_005888 [Letrouitia transgressa]
MEMESLREELESNLLRNIDSRQFIPDHQVGQIVSDNVVRACVEQSSIEHQLREDCIGTILAGGRRVLAILMMLDHEYLITKFVEKDNLLKDTTIDSRLPFPVAALESILSNKRLAIRFETRQWEVISPYFRPERNHRILPESTILPFTHQEAIREGGFGHIWKVSLPPGHHEFEYLRTGPLSSDQNAAQRSTENSSRSIDKGQVHIVRKIIKHGDDPLPSMTDPMFKNEERILSLLRSLRHPNMIQLLASFTVQKRAIEGMRLEHNLLFPLAETDLWSILRTNQDDVLRTYFPLETSLFQELHGLSAAIEALHDYTSGQYNLALIGCHYDLNPRNILVSHGKLLLTDFGLSRLRADTSKSIFAAGKGDYLAPECEPIEDDNFTRGVISRPSDIWSFGCILLEILVCLHWNARTVDNFRKQRKAKVLGCFTAYQFHKFGEHHPVVYERLDTLRYKAPPSNLTVLDVVTSILQIDPLLRPNAAEVTVQLYLQTVRIAFERVWERSRDMIALTRVLEGKVEHERLFLWGWASGFVHDSLLGPMHDQPESAGSHNWLLQTRTLSDQTLSVLNGMTEELDYILGGLRSQDRALHLDLAPLRGFNNSLLSFMPNSIGRRLASLLQDRMLSADDSSLIQASQTPGYLGDFHESYHDIVLLSALRHMTSRIEHDKKSQVRTLLLPNPLITERRCWHFYSVLEDKERSNTVLVEWVPYSRPSIEQDKMDELYNRIQALAELLHRPEMPPGFRVLRCLGYFLDVSQSSFGMVYQFPFEASQPSIPWTLKEVIQRFRRPMLGTLFKLAHDIAFCVMQFHRTNWLHKNISTHNIVFFRDLLPEGERDAPPAPKPHSTPLKETTLKQLLNTTDQPLASARPRKGEKNLFFQN